MSSTTLGERIINRLLVIDQRRADLARALNISPASVSDWITGKSKNLSAENLLSAADFLKCRPEWLLNGNGGATVPVPPSHYSVNEPSAYYGSPSIAQIIKILESFNSRQQAVVLAHLQLYQNQILQTT